MLGGIATYKKRERTESYRHLARYWRSNLMDTFQLKGHESKLCLSGLRTKEVGGLRKTLDGDTLAPSYPVCHHNCVPSFASSSNTKENWNVIASIFFPDFVPKKCEIWERQTWFTLNVQLVLFSYNKFSRSSWDLLTLKPGYLISQSYGLSHTSYITNGDIVREDFIINYG